MKLFLMNKIKHQKHLQKIKNDILHKEEASNNF
jgi:hypothetical protein